MNASKLPSEDPKEGISKVYRDALLYILKRIKAESIDNDLISPADIPDDIELEVTLEPNLAQDNLRNAQIAMNLKNAQLDLSNEWILSNIINVQDTERMKKEVTKEKFFNAIVGQIIQNQELMQPILMAAMRQKGKSQQVSESAGQQGNPQGQPQPSPEEMAMMQQQGGMMGGEAMPQTDAMIPTSERT